MGGGVIIIECMAYYAPSMKFRLFSPQSYFVKQQLDGQFVMNKNGVYFELNDKERIKIELNAANLPVALATNTDDVSSENLALYSCATDATNTNLPEKSKRLLQWHFRLGHCNFRLVRWMARRGYLKGAVDQSSKIVCDSCRIARGAQRPMEKDPKQTGAKIDASVKNTVKPLIRKIKENDLKPGDCISIDQYVCSHRGRLTTGYGKTPSAQTYGGGTIFVDHASGYIHVEHQISLSAADTIRSKRNFERILMNHGVLVRRYRADNGVFNSADFEEEVEKGSQSIMYSGVGAQHQNGVAERSIRTVVEQARTMLVHATIRNADNVDASLWPSALNHSCYLWNTVPKENNYSPIEILSSVVDSRSYSDLRHTHVWGCPVYILEYELASGKKLPKWNPRSRRGVYLGVSSAHSSNVPLVLSLKTGSISAQYHVVFDDCFSTVVSEGLQPQAWEKLFSYNNQSWSQLDEENDEPSRFERERLEKSRQQQREQQRIQNRESNQQHQTGRRISNNSRKSSGYSQQREGGNEKDSSITANKIKLRRRRWCHRKRI